MVTLVYSSVYSFVRDIDEFNKSKKKSENCDICANIFTVEFQYEEVTL